MSKFIDLTGQKFGRLTVLSKTNKKQCNHIIWVCQCDCGNIKEVTGSDLHSGRIKSCGCLQRESASNNREKRKTHGKTGTRLYGVWRDMKRRCNSSTASSYKNYGGRGIKVCEEWNDFENFYNWAMNSGYDENAEGRSCTLDRIDVNGNYCPENCRWVDFTVQANNRRSNRLIKAFGKEMTISQWSKLTRINKSTLKQRLDNGWSAEDSLITPPDYGNRRANNNE